MKNLEKKRYDSQLSDKEVLLEPRESLSEKKKETLEGIKSVLAENFDIEKLPKNLVEEMLSIRQEIRDQIKNNEYLDKVDSGLANRIRLLMVHIAFSGKIEEHGEVTEIVENEDNEIEIEFKDNNRITAGDKEAELLESLNMYFESYRVVHNASQFKRNFQSTKLEILEENEAGKLNFYSEDEKVRVLLERMQEKYIKAGFSEEEMQGLIELCDLKGLNNLGIEDLKILARTRDVFERFMTGDKAKYVSWSVALMIPAFIDGYAPIQLANAFESGDKIDMMHVAYYALLSTIGAGGSVLANKGFREFFDKNFSKDGGFAEHVSQNLAEQSGEHTGKFGMETVKKRIANAKDGYKNILYTISATVLPATVTLLTSAAMLYQKSPVLAAGTAAGTGIMLALNGYLDKKGKFFERERNAELTSEQATTKMEEQINAHLEIVLSGEKEKFAEELEQLLVKENIAISDRGFLKVIQDRFNRFFGAINMVVAGIATSIAGGSPDKFVAALAYSSNFHQSIANLLSAKRRQLSSLRSIMQMDLMFNGRAEEEKEKEKNRKGMDEIPDGSISLKNVSFEVGGKIILDNISLEIPEGSMVNLEGKTGSGKTTLIGIIAGYYAPVSGTVKIGNVDIKNIKKSGDESIYSKIAYLPQFPYILSGSVRDNLTFGVNNKNVTTEQVRGVLKEVGLNERFPNINEQLRGGRGDAGITSGGESSRIGLARTLLQIRNNDSRVVFLDEPTASVDPETRDKIAEVINAEKKRRPGATFIVISHDERFVEQLNCDSNIRIHNGKVVEDG